ncbi:beta-adducin-like [Notothenia coriiceps]|uniref:Beta-adducin-like n=1 Tax=Notothenia coriiceps TaxID=8208 RepID=A0A6I9NW36_9TELE|nr:PREDICTED: beta-adducin-like [Notothenia coriiceps]
MLDRSVHKPSVAGTVGWAGSTFGPLTKTRIGEHEFEALMRTMDNLPSASPTTPLLHHKDCFTDKVSFCVDQVSFNISS